MTNLIVNTGRLEPASVILRNWPNFRYRDPRIIVDLLIRAGLEKWVRKCEITGRNYPMAPNTATGAPNRPMQPNNPYYAHIAYVVNMGSDGQGAYSLSLFMLTPASNPAFIGGSRVRGGMAGTPPTTIGDTPGTTPALSVLDVMNVPREVILTSLAFIGSLIDRMIAETASKAGLMKALRSMGVKGSTLKTLRDRIVERAGQTYEVRTWPTVLTMKQAEKFAAAGVFSEIVGQGQRFVENKGQHDVRLDRAEKVAKELNQPLLDGWSDWMATRTWVDAPYVLINSLGVNATVFNEWAEGQYGENQYSPKMTGAMLEGERGFTLTDREGSKSDFQQGARDGCAKNLNTKTGEMKIRPVCTDMAGRPAFNAAHDLSGQCRVCGGKVASVYRHDIATRNNQTLKMPCLLKHNQPGPNGGDGKLSTTRRASSGNWGHSVQVGYNCPTGARTAAGKKVRKVRRASGGYERFIFTVRDHDEEGEPYEFHLLGRAFVEGWHRGNEKDILGTDAEYLLWIANRTHWDDSTPAWKTPRGTRINSEVDAVLGAL